MPPRPVPPALDELGRPSPKVAAQWRRHPRQRGFAIVLALLLAAFLVLLLASLSVLTRVETGAAAENQQLALARAQARFALAVAIGDLQKAAGPDQRATATSNLLPAAPVSPSWTGVWTTTDPVTVTERRNFPNSVAPAAPAWLISGNEGRRPDDPDYLRPDRALPAGTATVPILRAPVEGPGWSAHATPQRPDQHVAAPVRETTSSRSVDTTGAYAWWIGDEGVKASFTVAEPAGLPATDRFASPGRTGLAALPGFADYEATDDAFADRLRRLADRPDAAALAPAFPAALAPFFHDVAFHSRGVLADARRGGLRQDLSLAFSLDENAWRASAFNQGATAENVPSIGGGQLRVGYLFSEPVGAFGRFRGPTWDLLRNFHNLYGEVDPLSGISTFKARPSRPNTVDLGGYEANPTNIFNASLVTGDPYTTQSVVKGDSARQVPRILQAQLAPVISEVQLIFGVRTVAQPATSSDQSPKYRVELVFSPLVVLHNPYNVALNAPRSRIAFRGIPVRFNFVISDPEAVDPVPPPLPIDFEDLARSEVAGVSWTDFLRFYLPEVELPPGSFTVFSASGGVADFQRDVNAKVGKHDDGGFRLSKLYLSTDSKDPQVRANSLQPMLVSSSAQIRVHARTGMVEGIAAAPKEPARENYSLWLLHLLPGEGESESGGLNEVSQVQEIEVNVRPTDSTGRVRQEALDRYLGASPPLTSLPGVLAMESNLAPAPTPILKLGVVVKAHNHSRPGLTRPFVGGSPLAPSSRRFPEVQEIGGQNVGGFVGILPPWQPQIGPGGSWFQALQNDGQSGFFGGESFNPKIVSILEVPTSPLVSIGQLQHTPLAMHGAQPALVIGSSLASPFINRTTVTESVDLVPQGNIPGRITHGDIAFLANEAIWDRYFFSSFARIGNLPLDRVDSFLRGGSSRSSRLRLYRAPGRMEAEVRESLLDYRSIASSVLIDGSFNVNSTSVAAWTATLATHRNLAVSTLAGSRPADNRSPLGRLTRPLVPDAGNNLERAEAWGGLASYTDTELEELATAIVSQLRLRSGGTPFGSLGSFANRRLASNEFGLAGLLQAAIDASGINDRNPSPMLESMHQAPASDIGRFRYPAHGLGPTGAAATAMLTQGDLLQTLGPILAVRSDTFLVRTYGEVRNPVTGEVTGRAWVEAVVQRFPEPVLRGSDDPRDPERYHNPDPDAPVDFGRQFRIVQFRWLTPDEV